MILETERLYLRKMTRDDLAPLSRILQDREVMYAYEHAFTDEEVQAWLDKQLRRYREDGFGLWAVILKENGDFIGHCGLTIQDIGERQVIEVGYLFRRDCWHHGYAAEAAIACKNYAFEEIGAEEVYSIIRENNFPSQRVAERNGMTVTGKFVKHYYGIDMPHLIYSINRKDE